MIVVVVTGSPLSSSVAEMTNTWSPEEISSGVPSR